MYYKLVCLREGVKHWGCYSMYEPEGDDMFAMFCERHVLSLGVAPHRGTRSGGTSQRRGVRCSGCCRSRMEGTLGAPARARSRSWTAASATAVMGRTQRPRRQTAPTCSTAASSWACCATCLSCLCHRSADLLQFSSSCDRCLLIVSLDLMGAPLHVRKSILMCTCVAKLISLQG